MSSLAGEAISRIKMLNSREELRQVSQAVRNRMKQLDWQVGNSLKPGTRVRFDAKTRGIITGTVESIGQVNAKVMADNGVRWKVAMSMLEVIS